MNRKTSKIIAIFATTAVAALIPSLSLAQPYGTGIYDANVPYGSETSLSINTDGDINIANITPTAEGALGTGSSTITVTSTDVVGYTLYIQSLNNTYMDNLGEQIPASSTVPPSSPTTLSVNTWGYNTDASSNFLGITTTNAQINSLSGPSTSGHVTTVTYGLKVDLSKPAGSYSSEVVYTAAPQTN